MIQPIQIIFTAFILFALSRAYLRYKDGKIKALEFAFWAAIWLAAIIVVVLPSSVSQLSNYFGIGRPVDLITYVAIIVLFYLNFRLYVSIDTLEQKITKVVREVAIKQAKKK